MRLSAAILCLFALAACRDKRGFDERYNDTSAEIEQRARALDQNLANESEAEEPPGNSST
jgi:hypothetical protein